MGQMSGESVPPESGPDPLAKPDTVVNDDKDAPSLLATQGEAAAATHVIDAYLTNVSDAIQYAIRSQACRISIDSVTSNMSAFSTTSTRHREWESTIRMFLSVMFFVSADWYRITES